MFLVNIDVSEIKITIHGDKSIERFKDLIQRGAGLFPDAHPEIKEFADKITNNGIVLQNYREQAKDKYKDDLELCPHNNTISVDADKNPDHHPLKCLDCNSYFTRK